jgi:predicted transcriptional regulator
MSKEEILNTIKALVSRQTKLNKDFERSVRTETEKIALKFSQEIRNIRTVFGISQAELARRARVSQPYFAKFESGKVKNLELSTLVRIALALGLRFKIKFRPANID